MNRPNRIALWPAIGIMIDQKQIAMCVTAATARGRRTIAHETLDSNERDHEAIVGRLLEPWISAPEVKRTKLRPLVHLGLPEARVFQAAVPITATNQQNTAQNLFLEAVQATNVRAEDRIVELKEFEVAGRQLACVAASSRGAVESLIAMIARLSARVGLIEAGPAAARITGKHRAARSYAFVSSWASPMRSGSWPPVPVRFSGNAFELPSADETAAILAASRRSG
jgi:hypothetical protein